MSAYVLERVLGSSQRRIRDIARLLSDSETRRYGYAELHDLLMSLSTPELQRAIGERPFAPLSPDVENYVAAMIEEACTRRRIGVPGWVRAIPPLGTPAFASGLASLRLHLLASSPPSFKRRNIFVDTTLGGRV